MFTNCHFKGNHTYKGHCPNCDEDGHTAFSKKCSLYLREEEVLTIMYRQGLPKNKARSVLESTGMFAGTSYARRTAHKSNPPDSGNQENQQMKLNKKHQQQSNEQQIVQQVQQQTEPVTITAKPTSKEEKEGHEIQHPTPEDMMSTLFSSVSDPFLSVEAESVEQCSAEDPLPQEKTIPSKESLQKETGQKRKPEEAFSQSPTEEIQAHAVQVSKRKNDAGTEEFERTLTVEMEPQSTSSHKASTNT